MLGKVCFFNHLERRPVDDYVDKLWSAPCKSLFYIIFAYWRLQLQRQQLCQTSAEANGEPYAINHNILA